MSTKFQYVPAAPGHEALYIVGARRELKQRAVVAWRVWDRSDGKGACAFPITMGSTSKVPPVAVFLPNGCIESWDGKELWVTMEEFCEELDVRR